jgi:hypothetical protein
MQVRDSFRASDFSARAICGLTDFIRRADANERHPSDMTPGKITIATIHSTGTTTTSHRRKRHQTRNGSSPGLRELWTRPPFGAALLRLVILEFVRYAEAGQHPPP